MIDQHRHGHLTKNNQAAKHQKAKFGGIVGVYAISMSIYAAPKLGFLVLSGLIIFGQMVMSMLVDHLGLLGNEKMPVNWQRLLGGVVIFIGVLLTLQR